MTSKHDPRPRIWWSNAIFFVAIHVAAAVGVWYWPPRAVSRASLVLCFTIWQLADFGITVGYHRLYSHRAFHASFGVRLVLAALGCAAFQGSIKVGGVFGIGYIIFTDDPVHDPYAATRGLFYSHMGWIFYKPTYERLELVDREDLDSDPVVRFQHKYYVPLALSLGFLAPIGLGFVWGDAVGAFVWGGLISRLAIWHCTFMVNSLAHWDGLQPYSDEDTSRGNLHAFPHDFRSGPSAIDWDPSKWIILALHWLGLATRLRRAREEDLREAAQYMQNKSHNGRSQSESEKWDGPLWNREEVDGYVLEGRRCALLIDGFVLDVSKYLSEHPGGARLFHKYSIHPRLGNGPQENLLDASWAFRGGLNNHSRAARKRMQELRIARLI